MRQRWIRDVSTEASRFLRQQKSNHRFDTEGARECNERNPAAGAIFILKKNGNATKMDKQQSESNVAFLRQQKSNHRFDTEGARECNERNPAAEAIFIITAYFYDKMGNPSISRLQNGILVI